MGKAFRYLMIFIFLILGAFAAIFSVLSFVNGQFFGGFMLLAQTASFAIALWHLMFWTPPRTASIRTPTFSISACPRSTRACWPRRI